MTEAEFSKRYLPEVTVDVVVLSIGENGALQTLLTRRIEAPFEGRYALPGAFVGRSEPLDVAAARALKEKGGLTKVFLEQLYTFGAPDRDPRGRILSVGYYALVPAGRMQAALAAAAKAKLSAAIASVKIPWSGEAGGPVMVFDDGGKRIDLAFDHAAIIGTAVKRIRGKLDYAPIGFELLPDKFTLFELQRIHEAVLGRKLNKDSFRRKMLASGLIEDTKTRRTDTAFRPAALYRFKKEK